jgi:hypothetical protein
VVCENAAYLDPGVAWRGSIVAAESDIVVKLDFGVIAETGAPAPMLLQTERRTVLLFDTIHSDPNDPDRRGKLAGTAVVEFDGCFISKFGYPNDEALPGHPLYGRGLDGFYGFYEVRNPSWLEEIRVQNRVSFSDRANISGRHFIVLLHDSTFECLADDLNVSVVAEPMGNVVAATTRQIIAREYPLYRRSMWSRPDIYAEAEEE